MSPKTSEAFNCHWRLFLSLIFHLKITDIFWYEIQKKTSIFSSTSAPLGQIRSVGQLRGLLLQSLQYIRGNRSQDSPLRDSWKTIHFSSDGHATAGDSEGRVRCRCQEVEIQDEEEDEEDEKEERGVGGCQLTRTRRWRWHYANLYLTSSNELMWKLTRARWMWMWMWM